MKKLKLKALDLGATELLTRDQLKNVMGGDGSGSGNVNYGTCIGSVGCWSYTSPTSWNQCLQDISTYCRSGSGTCSVNYVCNS